MSSRNIAVRKDVYDALKRERGPSESFTRVLVRLLDQRGPLDELVGVWPGRPSRAEVRILSSSRGGRRGSR